MLDIWLAVDYLELGCKGRNVLYRLQQLALSVRKICARLREFTLQRLTLSPFVRIASRS